MELYIITGINDGCLTEPMLFTDKVAAVTYLRKIFSMQFDQCKELIDNAEFLIDYCYIDYKDGNYARYEIFKKTLDN